MTGRAPYDAQPDQTEWWPLRLIGLDENARNKLPRCFHLQSALAEGRYDFDRAQRPRPKKCSVLWRKRHKSGKAWNFRELFKIDHSARSWHVIVGRCVGTTAAIFGPRSGRRKSISPRPRRPQTYKCGLWLLSTGKAWSRTANERNARFQILLPCRFSRASPALTLSADRVPWRRPSSRNSPQRGEARSCGHHVRIRLRGFAATRHGSGNEPRLSNRTCHSPVQKEAAPRSSVHDGFGDWGTSGDALHARQ